MSELNHRNQEQTDDETLTLAALTITVIVYALLPFSRGTRWLGQSDIVLAVSKALKSAAEESDS